MIFVITLFTGVNSVQAEDVLVKIKPFKTPLSGYYFLSDESKNTQDDDFENPGFYAVETGAKLFNMPGKNGNSCATCHGDNGEKLDKKRIAMYPVYDPKLKKPITLQQKIRMEWSKKLNNSQLKYDGAKALALEVFVKNLARGEKVNVKIDGKMLPFYLKGKSIYHTRAGQLNMACAQCHTAYPGKHIRANLLSQGQSNGYPAYRLKNGKINGLHSRFNSCFKNIRAQKEAPGSVDYVALEVYVNSRGNGLLIESPGIRF